MQVDHPSSRHKHSNNLPSPLVVMENRWPAGTSTGLHLHPRGQLLYATDGVMVVHSDAGLWVVPPNRVLWMVTGLRHNMTMSGDVLMRTAYIDKQRIASLLARNCVINVSPLLRELLVEAVKISPAQERQGRNGLLLKLLICKMRVSCAMALPMPADLRLRSVYETLSQGPSETSNAADWARSIGVAERTLHRLFIQETHMTFAWRSSPDPGSAPCRIPTAA